MLHYLFKADIDPGGRGDKKNTVCYLKCQSLCITPYLTRCHRTTNRIRIYQTALQILILFEILQGKKTYAEIFKNKAHYTLSERLLLSVTRPIISLSKTKLTCLCS